MMKSGDKVIINGEEYPIKHGPWKYEQGHTVRSGYGLFVDFLIPWEVGTSSEWLWKYRCGIDQLQNFGFKIEEVIESFHDELSPHKD